MSTAALFDRTLRTLDGVRLSSFRMALRSGPLSAWVVRRERRLVLTTALHAGVAAVLAVTFPVLLFVLAPVLLGVAHVAADVRYLVLRRKLTRSWRAAIVTACLVLFGCQLLTLTRVWRVPERAELGVVVVWAFAAVAAAAGSARVRRRVVLGFGLVLLVGAAALAWPHAFRQLFLHAHNLIALALWPSFFRRRPRALLLLRAPIVALALLLATGVGHRITLASPGVHVFGLHALDLAAWLSPFARADLALGITSAFVFLQAVHYSIWLNVIPQAEQPGEGTLSFRQSARALTADFGRSGLVIVIVAALAVLLLATAHPVEASTSYVALALFHGYLELVLWLYFWIRGTRIRESIPRSRVS
jgi:hypothetical protein